MNEFTVQYKPTQVGIQSDIEIGLFDGVKSIRKQSGRELRPEDRQRIFEAIPEYRRKLEEAGLNIPHNFSLKRVNGHIETIDAFVEGKSVGESPTGLQAMIDQVLKADEHRVFIDAKTPNFICYGSNATYIDTFPPMLRDKDGLIDPWVDVLYKRDRNLMSFNFGDIKGQATKMLALALRETPQDYDQIAGEIVEYLDGRIDRKDFLYIRDQAERHCPDMTEIYSNPQAVIGIIKKITGVN